MTPHATLEQWRTLIAVVEAGSHAKAAEALHKSQSSVTYALQKLETQLDVRVFERLGRKAVLTDTGHTLYRRARSLLGEAANLEQAARTLAAGWEARVRLAVDQIFPTDVLLAALSDFSAEHPATRLEVIESVLSGAEEALLEGRAEMAITGYVPAGFLGESLLRLRFIAVAHPDHALHRLRRTLTYQDLRGHRQLVTRDSGRKRPRDSGWLDAEQRWTVSQITTSARAVSEGLGFAWLPELKIQRELAAGSLRPLPLREGALRYAELYLVFADPDYAGPATRQLAAMLRTRIAQDCRDAIVPRQRAGGGD